MTGLPRPNRVFVDASAYLALTNTREQGHAAAIAVASRLIAERRHLFTSNFVVAETHALVLSKLGRVTAFRLLSELDASTTTIVRVAAADERQARAILARYADKDFSLTDATSFAIMERLRIGAAFTLDDHFAQYGFQILEPE